MNPAAPRINSQQSISPSVYAPCDAVTHVRTSPEISANQRQSAARDSGVAVAVSQEPVPELDPRINGILDDPYNYYRQYPDDGDKAILHKLVTVDHLWPQPADDKMPPHQFFRMDDGTRMPFTPVNREPKTINCYGDFKNARWPVTLEPKERVQVALARFYELRAAARTELAKSKAEQAANTEQQTSAVS